MRQGGGVATMPEISEGRGGRKERITFQMGHSHGGVEADEDGRRSWWWGQGGVAAELLEGWEATV